MLMVSGWGGVGKGEMVKGNENEILQEKERARETEIGLASR